MEFFIYLIIFFVISAIIGAIENKSSSSGSSGGYVDSNNNPVPDFTTQTKQGIFTLDNGNKLDVFEFNIKGLINNPADRPVNIIACAMKDVTDSSNEAFCFSLDQQNSLDGVFFLSREVPSSVGTYFPDFINLGVVPIELIKFPFKGRRKIQCGYFVTDANHKISSISELKGSYLHFHKSNFYYTVPELGWKERLENSDRILELSVDLCMTMAASDGSLDQSELDVVKKWLKNSYEQLDFEEKNKKKLHFTNYLKSSYDNARKKTNSSSTLLDEFKSLSDNSERISLVELLLKVIGADGVFSKEEDELINSVYKKLDINQDTFNQLKNKAILNIDKLETSESSNELLFGITSSMSNSDKCKALRQQYTKWNSQKTSSDSNKRKKAEQMIQLIISLRTKYKCQ
jgi:uncharacterized tellurite resistance protein B-like protein